MRSMLACGGLCAKQSEPLTNVGYRGAIMYREGPLRSVVRAGLCVQRALSANGVFLTRWRQRVKRLTVSREGMRSSHRVRVLHTVKTRGFAQSFGKLRFTIDCVASPGVCGFWTERFSVISFLDLRQIKADTGLVS